MFGRLSTPRADQESLPITQPTPESSTDTVPVASGRCSPASAALASQIESRLTAEPHEGMPIGGGASLKPADIVVSDNGDGLYPVGVRSEGTAW